MNDPKPARILIADDEPLFLRTTGDLLRQAGFECVCVPDAPSALRALATRKFDLLLSDLNMPGNLKLELLHSQAAESPGVPIIVITGVPSLPSAIESLRLGIIDYLLKPLKFDDLLASIRRALERSRKPPNAAGISSRDVSGTGERKSIPDIVGRCPGMLEIMEIIERVAATDTNILITGETGTGKEVIARTIHERSHRSAGRFQVIDCTAVPESLFESILFGHVKGAFTGAVRDQAGLLKLSDGGTAFLDELGELPQSSQSKLLRAIQEQTFTPVGDVNSVRVDTRFICATNRPLEQEVAAGRFRQDLFYRLGVMQIQLPPLRERGDDIAMLAENLLERLKPASCRIRNFSEQAMQLILNYHWPGNIRELRNVIERAVALAAGDQIEVCDLPPGLTEHPSSSAGPTGETTVCSAAENALVNTGSRDSQFNSPGISRDMALEEAERQYLLNLMHANRGNVSEAARQAGVSRQGMHKLLNRHGIVPSNFRALSSNGDSAR